MLNWENGTWKRGKLWALQVLKSKAHTFVSDVQNITEFSTVENSNQLIHKQIRLMSY